MIELSLVVQFKNAELVKDISIKQVKGDQLMPDEVKFCPLLTVVRAGQATYLTCQATCVFYIEGECAFITATKLLKQLATKTNKTEKQHELEK